MSAPGVTTSDLQKKTVQAFTSATAPRAAEHGPFPAIVDGIPWLSNGVSNDAFPSGWSVGSSGANMSSIVRNASGDITSFVQGGITKTVTYNSDGTVNTVSGGGFTMTVSYSGGEVSGVTYS